MGISRKHPNFLPVSHIQKNAGLWWPHPVRVIDLLGTVALDAGVCLCSDRDGNGLVDYRPMRCWSWNSSARVHRNSYSRSVGRGRFHCLKSCVDLRPEANWWPVCGTQPLSRRRWRIVPDTRRRRFMEMTKAATPPAAVAPSVNAARVGGTLARMRTNVGNSRGVSRSLHAQPRESFQVSSDAVALGHCFRLSAFRRDAGLINE